MQALRTTVLAKRAATILELNLRYKQHCAKLWAQKVQIQREIEKGFAKILAEIDAATQRTNNDGTQKGPIARRQNVDIQDLLPSLSAFEDSNTESSADRDMAKDNVRQQRAERLQTEGNTFSH